MERPNEDGPAVAPTTVAPGLTPKEEGLMVQSTHSQAPRALCPACGRLPDKSCFYATNGVTTAHYVCQRGHGWLVKWGEF